jgi:hypothetical protein
VPQLAPGGQRQRTASGYDREYRRSSGLLSGLGREVNLLKISAAISAVKPMNSSATILMADCRRSKVKFGEELKLLKRTETELLDERETLSWLEGGIGRAPLTSRLPGVDGVLELRKTKILGIPRLTG